MSSEHRHRKVRLSLSPGYCDSPAAGQRLKCARRLQISPLFSNKLRAHAECSLRGVWSCSVHIPIPWRSTAPRRDQGRSRPPRRPRAAGQSALRREQHARLPCRRRGTSARPQEARRRASTASRPPGTGASSSVAAPLALGAPSHGSASPRAARRPPPEPIQPPISHSQIGG